MRKAEASLLGTGWAQQQTKATSQDDMFRISISVVSY